MLSQDGHFPFVGARHRRPLTPYEIVDLRGPVVFSHRALQYGHGTLTVTAMQRQRHLT